MKRLAAWLFLLSLFCIFVWVVGYKILWSTALFFSKDFGMHPFWCLLAVLFATTAFVFIPLWCLWQIHQLINFCCWHYAVRYCRKNNLEFLGGKVSPAFKNGVKTEYTAVMCKCRDTEGNLKLVCVIAWVFGIREVVVSDFPITQVEENDASNSGIENIGRSISTGNYK